MADHEVLGQSFTNARGEIIDSSVGLLNQSETGRTWTHWAAKYLPRELFKQAGLMGDQHPDALGWFNVVEHTVKVAGTAFTMAEMLRARGVAVNSEAVVRAAMVHDLTKRGAVVAGMTRDAEDKSELLPTILRQDGSYSELEISAAANTGRSAVRSNNVAIVERDERLAVIRSKGIEAAIVGLSDALMRGTDLLTLEEAQTGNLKAKPDAASQSFFTDEWHPYYTDVISYLGDEAPGFRIEDITDEAVFAAIEADAARLDQASFERQHAILGQLGMRGE